MYEVYFGKSPNLLGAYTPLKRLEQAARGGRVWMIFNPQVAGLTCFPDVFACLRRSGSIAVNHAAVQGLEIVLYEPARPDPNR